MNEELIPSKWQFIANWLIELSAPKRVINAAVEIDNALIRLGLGYNTKGWEQDIDHISRWNRTDLKALMSLIKDDTYCTACQDCNNVCRACKLGEGRRCTPRSKHADQYFSIVRGWIESNVDLSK